VATAWGRAGAEEEGRVFIEKNSIGPRTILLLSLT
jgi:hypothetical protein